ncbi:unnamed protein product [Anisakis simplex]|uniref:Uncharacterized protein n=1 Tax=Anisakis simplex TaxID=6269 RepID=A0A0M3JZK7_ANISI|nr:unnamed protein product [Anisakis simplex]
MSPSSGTAALITSRPSSRGFHYPSALRASSKTWFLSHPGPAPGGPIIRLPFWPPRKLGAANWFATPNHVTPIETVILYPSRPKSGSYRPYDLSCTPLWRLAMLSYSILYYGRGFNRRGPAAGGRLSEVFAAFLLGSLVMMVSVIALVLGFMVKCRLRSRNSRPCRHPLRRRT